MFTLNRFKIQLHQPILQILNRVWGAYFENTLKRQGVIRYIYDVITESVITVLSNAYISIHAAEI